MRLNKETANPTVKGGKYANMASHSALRVKKDPRKISDSAKEQ
jgi:hypothetical protein